MKTLTEVMQEFQGAKPDKRLEMLRNASYRSRITIALLSDWLGVYMQYWLEGRDMAEGENPKVVNKVLDFKTTLKKYQKKIDIEVEDIIKMLNENK